MGSRGRCEENTDSDVVDGHHRASEGVYNGCRRQPASFDKDRRGHNSDLLAYSRDSFIICPTSKRKRRA